MDFVITGPTSYPTLSWHLFWYEQTLVFMWNQTGSAQKKRLWSASVVDYFFFLGSQVFFQSFFFHFILGLFRFFFFFFVLFFFFGHELTARDVSSWSHRKAARVQVDYVRTVDGVNDECFWRGRTPPKFCGFVARTLWPSLCEGYIYIYAAVRAAWRCPNSKLLFFFFFFLFAFIVFQNQREIYCQS